MKHEKLRAWLITSRVTFVPGNYSELVKRLAKSEFFEGLIVLDNFAWDWVLKASMLILSGAAPRLGKELFVNSVDSSWEQKISFFREQSKVVRIFRDINEPEALDFLESVCPDLLVNARTRTIYRDRALGLARFGAINIHHGLLPNQRGLMCDFWARSSGVATGFSIHQMTKRLDDGGIYVTKECCPGEKNYLSAARVQEEQEAKAVLGLLERFQSGGFENVRPLANTKTDGSKHYKNPGIFDFYRARSKGLQI